MADTNQYSEEENLGKVIWEFLPGILAFLSFIALIVTIMVGGQVFLKMTDTLEEYTFPPNLIRPSTPIYGNRESDIHIVLVSDFQCPACASYHATFSQIEEIYKDRVLFVYKDYPLDTIHPYATDLAKAGYAANKQGLFVEFSRLAFSNTDELYTKGVKVIDEWAKQINGLDLDKFNLDRKTQDAVRQIEFSQEDLNQISLPKTSNSQGSSKGSGEYLGTPTTIIMRGEAVLDWWTGAADEVTVKNAIDYQLN